MSNFRIFSIGFLIPSFTCAIANQFGAPFTFEGIERHAAVFISSMSVGFMLVAIFGDRKRRA